MDPKSEVSSEVCRHVDVSGGNSRRDFTHFRSHVPEQSLPSKRHLFHKSPTIYHPLFSFIFPYFPFIVFKIGMAHHLDTKQSEPMAVEVADQTEPLSSPPSHNSDAGKIADSPPSPPVEEAQGSKMVDSEQPVHRVLGGGKPADVLLWKNKKISAGILGGATAIWAFFEVLEYHLLPLICYALILVVALLFLWSNAHIFIYKSPPHLPEVRIKDEPFLQVASAARTMINRAIAMLGDIASGRDVKKFLAVVAGLWILSVIGSWCNFLTLFYIAVVLLHTVPVVYEKYKGKIDTSAQRIMVESKKRYAVFNEKVVSKLPKGVFREKKE